MEARILQRWGPVETVNLATDLQAGRDMRPDAAMALTTCAKSMPKVYVLPFSTVQHLATSGLYATIMLAS